MLILVVALQGQVMRWLKHREAEADLLVVDAHAPDMVQQLEAGILGGLHVILQARRASRHTLTWCKDHLSKLK